MPNWCYTTYKIVGESKEELQDLHEKLMTLQQLSEEYALACYDARNKQLPTPEAPPEIVESGFKLFLGTVVKAYGGDWEKVRCRGGIEAIGELQDGIFELYTETAWGEMNEVWDLVMSHYKTLRYYFLAEESGNLYFATNDVDEEYFPEKYFVYDSISDEEEYINNEEDLLINMARRLNVEKIDSIEELDELINEFDEKNPDDCLYYHEIDREQY